MRFSADTGTGHTAFQRSSIRRGLQLFAALSILGLMVLFYVSRPSGVLEPLRRLRFQYVALALGLSTVDWLGGGLRLYNFVRHLSKKIGYWACVRANLGNIFMGAVTPAQTGGGPAQIVILFREGLPLPEAMISSLMTFVCTLIFLILSAAAVLLVGEFSEASLAGGKHILRYSSIVFGFIAVLVLIAFVRPEAAKAIIMGCRRTWLRLRGRRYSRESGWWAVAVVGIERCHECLSLYVKRGKLRLLGGVLLSAIVFGNKWVIAYIVVRGLGLGVGLGQVIAIQVVLTYLLYFFPSPGASGAAELGSAALMAAIVPKGLLSVYTVLWRFLATYVSVGIGGLVVLSYIRAGREAKP